MASISLRGVQKAYGDGALVIRDVDLEIGENEFCVFLGPSGCGKSTLLRMIAGLEDVTDGDLSIAGRLVNDVPAAQRGVAMVFQSYALFPHMTVFENMAFGLKLAKTPRDEIDRKVREAARILQLEALLERRPKATRWRWPPESWRGLRFSNSLMPRMSAASRTRRSISGFSNLRIFRPNAMLSYTLMCG